MSSLKRAVLAIIKREIVLKPWVYLYWVLILIVVPAAARVPWIFIFPALLGQMAARNIDATSAHGLAFVAPNYKRAEFIANIVLGVVFCAAFGIASFSSQIGTAPERIMVALFAFCIALWTNRLKGFLVSLSIITLAVGLLYLQWNDVNIQWEVNAIPIWAFAALLCVAIATTVRLYQKVMAEEYDPDSQPLNWKESGFSRIARLEPASAPSAGMQKQFILLRDWLFEKSLRNPGGKRNALLEWGLFGSNVASYKLAGYGLLPLTAVYIFVVKTLADEQQEALMIGALMGLFLLLFFPAVKQLAENRKLITRLWFLNKDKTRSTYMMRITAVYITRILKVCALWLGVVAAVWVLWPETQGLCIQALVALILYVPWAIAISLFYTMLREINLFTDLMVLFIYLFSFLAVLVFVVASPMVIAMSLVVVMLVLAVAMWRWKNYCIEAV